MRKNNRWTTDNIPDQTGRIAIITGANSGIGYETARALVKKGAHVIMASRNEEKCSEAAANIKREHFACKLEIIPLDLADLTSIRTFIKTFDEGHDRLDLLINNAGVMAYPNRHTTADGFELQFGTNHLGHFALTGLLMDQMVRTEGSRVVNVSSVLHYIGKVDFDNLDGQKSYNKWRAYGQSKLSNLLFTYELQRKLSANGNNPISVAAHPGYASTNLQNYTALFRTLNPIFAQSQEMGALPILLAATDTGINGCDFTGPGGFFGQWGYPTKTRSSKRSYDETLARRLWSVSEELTGVSYNFSTSIKILNVAGTD